MIDIRVGDCREVLAGMDAGSVQCCVTSPPYFGLRSYGGGDAEIGRETTPDEFVAAMVAVFREVRRVLRDDATLWLNLGDSYAANRGYQVPSTKGGKKHGPAQASGGAGSQVPLGLKPKDLIGIPWRVAFALQADGWYLRSEIIWHKPSPMPESVTDRPTKAHEHVFLLTKGARYYYDAKAVAEPAKYPGDNRAQRGDTRKDIDPFCADGGSRARTGKPVGDTVNRRSVWAIASQPFSGSHFATMPRDLAEICIKAGSRPGDTILDPFGGAGTTGLVADRLQRNATLIELNPAYAAMARDRIDADAGLFARAAE